MTSKDSKKSEKLEDNEPLKINKWDGAAAKHAVDDSVKKALLKKPNCVERFAIVDGRLFICTLAVSVALVALGYDYKFPFPQSREILIGCVASYFVLMGILTLYTTYVEKGIFAQAVQKDEKGQRTWTASSEMKKYDDKYHLTLSLKDAKGGREATSIKSIASYIDENGLVLEDLVANELNRLYNSIWSLTFDKKNK